MVLRSGSDGMPFAVVDEAIIGIRHIQIPWDSAWPTGEYWLELWIGEHLERHKLELRHAQLGGGTTFVLLERRS